LEDLVMEELPVFVAGILVGLVLAAAAVALRRRSVVDLDGAPQRPEPARAVASSPDLPDEAGAALGDPLTSSVETTPRGLRFAQTKVLRRISARLEPGGRLAITIDGQEYHNLEDIPDAATRDQVTVIMKSLPGQVTDPTVREKVEGELHDAGIDDSASGGDPTTPG
jgi:hypothetical protein